LFASVMQCTKTFAQLLPDGFTRESNPSKIAVLDGS